MPFTELATGAGRKVLYWTRLPLDGDENARQQAALSNCPGLTEVERQKVLRLFAPFIQTGEPSKNSDKFKKIEKQGKLYAFKAHQIRLIGTFLDRKTFVICHCTRKKQMKYRGEDLSLAQANMKSMLKEWQGDD